MHKEIFKLHELLQESGMPYFFNWLEDQKPTPFSEGQKIDEDNYTYIISIGAFDGVTVMPENDKDKDSLLVILLGANEEGLKITVSNANAETAFEILKKEFDKYKDEWYPKETVTEEDLDDSEE